MKKVLNKSWHQRIRDLIIGKHNFIESWGDYKQVMLSGQFAIISILLCVLYTLFDILSGNYETLPIYGCTIFFLWLTIFSHRNGDHKLANYFLLPTMNITVYLIASSETSSTGAYIFFVVNAVAAFALFSYNQRLLSILYAVFTYALFALAYFFDFSILSKRNYTEELALLNIVINFSMALLATVMCVYLLITLNHNNAIKLEQSNEMLKKTNTELDRFVYSTSHDLRAPLTSVMGLINISEEAKDPQEVKRYLAMMKDRVNSLDKFIKDITDYSRNNRLEVKREKINLPQLAHEIWESLKYSPEAERIDFDLDIPKETVVESDKNRLRMIISNLISNAIRYHDGRKEKKFIRLQHMLNGKVFYLKVEDNGQGIAPEYQTRIFDMFFRGNENSKGSGLGLYIVKETLSKLSGSIHLESAPGRGSTFTIKLPKR